MSDYVAFTVIALLLVMSPGPNSVLIMKTVGSKGKQAGIENIVGLVTATFVHGAVSILGLSAILLNSSYAFSIIKYIGAAYLIYLGLKTILSTLSETKTKKSNGSSVVKAPSKLHQNFAEGFLTQLLNPKVSMFYLAAFPQFISFQSGNYAAAFTLVSIHAAIIFFWFFSVTLCISKLKTLTNNGWLGLWVQRLSGALLVFFGGLLTTQDANR